MTRSVSDTESLSILIIASGDLWAGAEAVVHQLAKGLSASPGVSVSAVFLNEGRLAEQCRALNMQTFIVDETQYSFPVIVKRLTGIARSIRPHIIHSHRYKENILSAMIAPGAGFPKLITTLHGIFEVRDSFQTYAISAINTLLMRMVLARTVAVSQDLVGYLADQVGVPTSRICRIYNGIDIDAPSPHLRKSTGLVTIGSAGRLVPIKDYALMVDIAAVVCTNRNDVRFILAGDGPKMPALRKQVHDLGLDEQFLLLGQVDDIGAFYSELDIYINTSIHEGIPMTVLEAMSHALPVVAPAVGGLSEIIEHGRNGYLIPKREIGAFARVLEELIAGQQLRYDVGANARQRVADTFSMQAMVQSYLVLYREILSVGGRIG